MEPAEKQTSDGQLGSIELENILFNYSKELKEFAETINIYEPLSVVLVDSKIDELSHLRIQEIENALRKLPKPPSFQLRTQIFNSIQKTNEEFKGKIHAAQQQYESALITLRVKLTETYLKMVHDIVDGKTGEKSAKTLYKEKIELIQTKTGDLDQKHQKLVQRMFEDDTAELLSGMTLVEEALLTYRKDMTNHFQSYRCMSSQLVSNLHKQSEMNAKAKCNSDSSHLFQEFVNGLKRMHDIFAAMNELIIKSENNLVSEMNQREPRIVNFYKKMMKNEKQEDYKIPELKLKETHIKDDAQLVEEVKKLSVKNLMVTATKAVYNQRRIYNCKMEECLKKAGGMMDLLRLKKYHDSYASDATSTVVFELKKIEGLEGHLNYVETLQRKIESDWLDFKTENNNKLREKEEIEREVTVNVLQEKVLQTQGWRHPQLHVPQYNRQVPPRCKTKNPIVTKSSKTDMQPRTLSPPRVPIAYAVSAENLQRRATRINNHEAPFCQPSTTKRQVSKLNPSYWLAPAMEQRSGFNQTDVFRRFSSHKPQSTNLESIYYEDFKS